MDVSTSTRSKSKTTTQTLCFTMGFLGAHRFYLGQWKIALLYIVLIPTGASVLAWFLESIRLYRMSPATFQSKLAQGKI
jgi:TM2 domain-containing membrane protein YozV